MTEINGPAGPEQPAWHGEAAEATEKLRQAAGITPDEPSEGPRRVVGTPPPAQARALLVRPEDEEEAG